MSVPAATEGTSRQRSARVCAAAWVLIVAAFALTGCVGKNDVQTRFYLLSPLPASTPALLAAREHSFALDIAALRLPQYLQRPQIVTRTSDNQVRLAEYDQWGGNLAKNMMRVLAQNLSRLLVTPEITVFSRRPARATDLRVEIDVLQFERGPEGQVLLAAQWRLRHGTSGAPVITRISELNSPALDPKAGMETTIGAMSTVWAEFGRIIAEAIVEAVAATGGASRG
jgi:uncharacterized lipoprotein YmbA